MPADGDTDVVTSHVSVRSFSCDGCDCGACGTDAVRDLIDTPGVMHVRLDRRARAFVVRHDTVGVDVAAIEAIIDDARLPR